MGEVIDSDASVEDREADVRDSYTRAMSVGGVIAESATRCLAASIEAMDSAKAILDAATAAADASWLVVLARDGESDAAIASTRDELYNALGRPQRHPAMDHTYPGGIGTYTAGDPLGQPLLMQVLTTRIASANAPQWSPELRASVIARIDAARVPQEAAGTAYRPLGAALDVAEAGRRANVRTAHARLVSFKRDLKNAGLTEAQIHDVIPDRPSKKKKKKDPTGS